MHLVIYPLLTLPSVICLCSLNLRSFPLFTLHSLIFLGSSPLRSFSVDHHASGHFPLFTLPSALVPLLNLHLVIFVCLPHRSFSYFLCSSAFFAHHAFDHFPLIMLPFVILFCSTCFRDFFFALSFIIFLFLFAFNYFAFRHFSILKPCFHSFFFAYFSFHRLLFPPSILAIFICSSCLRSLPSARNGWTTEPEEK